MFGSLGLRVGQGTCPCYDPLLTLNVIQVVVLLGLLVTFGGNIDLPAKKCFFGHTVSLRDVFSLLQRVFLLFRKKYADLHSGVTLTMRNES